MHSHSDTPLLPKKLRLLAPRAAGLLAALSLAVAGGSAQAQYAGQQQVQQGAGAAPMSLGAGSASFGGTGAGMSSGMGAGTPGGPVILGGSNGSDWPPATTNVQNPPPKPYVPGEFERFVNKVAREASAREGQGNEQNSAPPQGFDNAASAPSNAYQQNQANWAQAGQTQWIDQSTPPPILRFGSDLITSQAGFSQDFSPQVPPDYLISPGDELVLSIWGSVDANLRLVVDRAGRVNIPRVGSVMVSGVRYADLPAVLRRQVSQVFRNFQLSISLGRLRSIRIYVTGFATQPGSYTVSSLSTIVNALMQTGGPSSAGSFRDIELRRDGKLITTFDLYDLLLRGNTSGDRVLQADDVLQIGPVGPQVAVIGSVNRPAIFELRPGDTVDDVLRMAAGFSPVADTHRLAVERLADRESLKVRQIDLPRGATQPPESGDIFRAFSLVASVQPVQRQNKHVRVEGEILHPGDYILPPNSTINDAIKAAGGLTSMAFLYGTEFDRESVRESQQENYDRALRDLEAEYTRSTLSRSATSDAEVQAQQASSTNINRLIDTLRSVKPSGRIVLQMSPEAQSLPDLALEDGDRLYVPTRPTTIGVFGSVFNGGSYLYDPKWEVGDYLRLAGGPTRSADADSIFVIRANGTVISARQDSGWFGLGGSLASAPSEPGDTVFVPDQFEQHTFVQNAKDWTQILYQFGLGVAALKSLQ